MLMYYFSALLANRLAYILFEIAWSVALIRNRRVLTLPILLLLGVGGCATNSSNKVPMAADEFSAALSQSNVKIDSYLANGNSEEAVKLLDELARRNPGRKEPWIRKAKVYFDSENYAQAIVAAEEALQRDATDRTAKSIRAVAGLRVAAQSLNGLRGDVELRGGARADALVLTKVMRETLGEDVLVPTDSQKKKTGVTATPVAKSLRSRAAAEVPPSIAPTAVPNGSAQSANKGNDTGTVGSPFGALR